MWATQQQQQQQLRMPQAQGGVNVHGDVVIPNSFNDCISSVSWSPTSNLLVGTSWSRYVRCWDIQGNGQAVPKAEFQHQAPVLCSQFHSSGEHVFTGSCDKTVKMWDLRTSQQIQVGQHDQPVVECKYFAEKQLLVTGSWDKTLRYWDCRQPNPAYVVSLPERVYAMDCRFPVLVVCTSNRGIVVYNLENPQQPFRTLTSPLKLQTTCVSISTNRAQFIVASLEGRVGIQPVDDKKGPKAFAYKCHREDGRTSTLSAYPVNALSFHPNGTFVSCGSDGGYNFWDLVNKTRLKHSKSATTPITCASFNRDGTILAYAFSYDWNKGIRGYDKSKQPQLSLHSVRPDDVEPRPKKKY